MLTFLARCTHVGCYATEGLGGVGHVNVPCTLHMLNCWMLRNWRVGVGWGMLTVNVPCTLHTCWMLRNWRGGVGWGFAERGRSWRKKLTLQLLTIYMILRMLVMMLKMMMLWWWWWWWCDDDHDDDVHYDDDSANKTSSFLKRRWCIFTCWMCKIIASL